MPRCSTRQFVIASVPAFGSEGFEWSGQMKMHITSAVLTAMLIAAGPAVAASSMGTTTSTTKAPAMAMISKAKPAAKTHYYIAESVATKACSVVTTKPNGKTATMVGKYWYSSMAKANAAMKKAAVCKSA